MDNIYETQLAIEDEATGLGISKMDKRREKAASSSTCSTLAPENYLLRSAVMKMAEKIEDYLMTKPRGNKDYQKIRSILVDVEPEELAYPQ